MSSEICVTNLLLQGSNDLLFYEMLVFARFNVLITRDLEGFFLSWRKNILRPICVRLPKKVGGLVGLKASNTLDCSVACLRKTCLKREE